MRGLTCLLIASLLGCGDAPMSSDAGSEPCATDDDCQDGIFCNGLERCLPSAAAADPRGCVAASDPCDEERLCSEERDRCETDCAVVLDFDGDGVDAAECGGEDCDDGDADRFPANPEICDADGRDEDCDPSTLGGTDADGDGFESSACCNTQSDGSLRCGEDCDDAEPSARPGQLDNTCDGLDNDCDGDVDESGTPLVFVRDTDGDGYGDESRGSMEICAAAVDGYARLTGDCDDDDPTVFPDAPQLCDRIENRCADAGGSLRASEDMDDDGYAAVDADCDGGPLAKTDCDDTNAAIAPDLSERCFSFAGSDTDCDGTVDEGCPTGITVGDPESSMRVGLPLDGGSNPFDERCPAGSGLSQLYIDSEGSGMTGVCHAPSFGSFVGPSVVVRPSSAETLFYIEGGGDGGPTGPIGCDAEYLTGIRYRLEPEGDLSGLDAICEEIEVLVEDGAATYSATEVTIRNEDRWGDGVDMADALRCPVGSVVSGIEGATGGIRRIESFGIRCRPLTLTP